MPTSSWEARAPVTAARVCSIPQNADWKYYLGVVSDGQAAVEPLRAALRLRDYLPAKLRLGEVLLSLGDSAAAREVFRGLDHPAALFGFGRATNDPAYYEKALGGISAVWRGHVRARPTLPAHADAVPRPSD